MGYVVHRLGNKKKLDDKATKAKFIDYDDNSKAYLMDLATKKVTRARSVKFEEGIISEFSKPQQDVFGAAFHWFFPTRR